MGFILVWEANIAVSNLCFNLTPLCYEPTFRGNGPWKETHHTLDRVISYLEEVICPRRIIEINEKNKDAPSEILKTELNSSPIIWFGKIISPLKTSIFISERKQFTELLWGLKERMKIKGCEVILPGLDAGTQDPGKWFNVAIPETPLFK